MVTSMYADEGLFPLKIVSFWKQRCIYRGTIIPNEKFV